MGRIYLEHLGGSKLFSCAECDTFISNREELFSSRFLASTERAYSFNKVVNVTYSEKPTETQTYSRNNILSANNSRKSEKHFIRYVFCKVCTTKLGWTLEIRDTSKSQVSNCVYDMKIYFFPKRSPIKNSAYAFIKCLAPL